MYLVLSCNENNATNKDAIHAYQVIPVIIQETDGPNFKGYIPLYKTYEDAVKDFPYGKIAAISGL